MAPSRGKGVPMVRWIVRAALLLPALALLAAVAAWWLLRGSLPGLEGTAPLPGLAAPAEVARDAHGVATVGAASASDAARALGYVHAQERWFEMDLMRRSAAGELAALFGPMALDADRAQRVHRMRVRARAAGEAAAPAERALLEAYAEGANAGLAALRTRPWPYLLLRTAPEPWRAEDSMLVGYAMYFDLQDAGNARELALWRVRPHLPEALYALVAHAGSDWDAPLAGPPVGDAAVPGPGAVDLRALPVPAEAAGAPAVAAESLRDIGSNNFAVAGALTAHGGALVADDMHLGLRAPGIWFRARLRYPDDAAPGGRVDVSGFTLPGLPAVIVGSNGHVAWGFTNSYGDTLDWAIESPCPADASAGRAGCTPLARHEEQIDVAGAATEALVVEESDWGP